MGDAWLQFRIRYYMFALVFVVFDVETVFLYPWAMSFDVLGVSVFIEASFLSSWRRAIFPQDLPYSIVTAVEFNHQVRDGLVWFLYA